MIGGDPDEIALCALGLDAIAERCDVTRSQRPANLDRLRKQLSDTLSRLGTTAVALETDPVHGVGPMGPFLLTYDEAAAQLRCSVRSIERAVSDDKLVAVRIGRSVRIRPQDLATYIAELPSASRQRTLEAV